MLSVYKQYINSTMENAINHMLQNVTVEEIIWCISNLYYRHEESEFFNKITKGKSG